jgi:TrmH family RNA methyltransferase
MTGEPEIRIVLVRPKESRNVGAVCRAMKTMGLSSLSLVADSTIDPQSARAVAHYASDVLENARMCADIGEAVGDAVLIAGTTRRRGKRRKYFSLLPEQLAERVRSISRGAVAILFGNEDTGLTDAELSLCHLAVTIPTVEDFQSLNLSHAVQIVCYEIFRALSRGRITPFTPITSRDVDSLVQTMTRSLKAIGFFKLVGPEQMAVFLKDIIARAALSVNEARRLGVTFKKIGGLVTRRGIDRNPLPP